MKFQINTIDDFNIKGKTVLLRVDINQPIDRGKDELLDTTRIKGCLPTITELSEKGAKLVMLAHQGSDIEYNNYYNLKPHAKALSSLLGKTVEFVPDVCGPYALEKIREIKEGNIILLDNVRFMAEEMTLFETKVKLSRQQQTKTQVVKRLSPFADLFIVDAFAAAHRSQPTLTAFAELIPSAMGRLFEKEYSVLANIIQAPKKPLIFVLGGAKIQDAFLMMGRVLNEGIADKVIMGGLVGNVMLAAKGYCLGETSLSFILQNNLGEYIEKSKELLKKHFDKIMVPVDLAYADSVRHEAAVDNLPSKELFVDIGSKSADMFVQQINNAATVFVNGPMGIFEKPFTEYGTKKIWNALANTSAFTVIGGGDSVAATNKYSLADKMDYICTGGGAMVRFLSGETLPVIEALKFAANKFKRER